MCEATGLELSGSFSLLGLGCVRFSSADAAHHAELPLELQSPEQHPELLRVGHLVQFHFGPRLSGACGTRGSRGVVAASWRT